MSNNDKRQHFQDNYTRLSKTNMDSDDKHRVHRGQINNYIDSSIEHHCSNSYHSESSEYESHSLHGLRQKDVPCDNNLA